jgi:hypothetical protein
MAIKKVGLIQRRVLRKVATQTTKRAKLGGGKRFAAVKAAIAGGLKPGQIRAGQTREQAAAGIAAAAGRRKYGAARMAKMAAVGRKRRGRK